MANGRRALSSSASRGTLGKSLLCHSGVMWITELARNTITAESRIGSHSDSRLTMETPYILTCGCGTASRKRAAAPGGTLTNGAPPHQVATRASPTPGAAPWDPDRACPDPSEGAFRKGWRKRKLLFEKRKCGTSGGTPGGFSTLMRRLLECPPKPREISCQFPHWLPAPASRLWPARWGASTLTSSG